MLTEPSPNGQTPPKARNRLVLPEPEGPRHQHALAGRDREPVDAHDLLAVGQADGEIVDGEIAVRRRRDLELRRRRVERLRPVERRLEAGQPVSTAFQSAMLL